MDRVAARRRPVLWLVGIAVVAVLLAGYFAWLTIFRPAKVEPSVETRTVVNRVGGYALQVPTAMTVKRSGKTTQLGDAARSLSVTVTTTEVAAPRTTNAAVVRAMRSAYRSVTVLATKNRNVDRRPALTTYGAVVTDAGKRVQFVLVTVRGVRKNFSLSAFTPIGSSGSGTTNARFEAIVKGFRITP